MYKYQGCGLENIYLRNGVEIMHTESGMEVVRIEDQRGLHKVIAHNLCQLNRPLSGKEFRFLRKELDLSQRQVAMMVGFEEQTVSLWEREQQPVNPPAERIVRLLMAELLDDNLHLRQLLERFSEIDRVVRATERMEFEVNAEWRQAA